MGTLEQIEERLDRMTLMIEQLIHMVAENNRTLADFRTEVNERFAKVDERFAKVDERFAKVDERFDKMGQQMLDLRSEVSMIGERLVHNEEQMRRDRFQRDGESRHFAQAIGVLERDVATLKER